MTRQAVPGWFWAVAVILLLWSLAGVGAFGAQVSMSAEQLAQLPKPQRDAFESMPNWAWIAYGIATVGGLAAAICLLLRRSWATPLYAISLVAVVAQFGWTFIGFKLLETVPVAEAVPFPALIVILAIASLWFSRFATKRGWLA